MERLTYLTSWILSILIAYRCAQVAKHRGRSPNIWFLLGLIFNIFAFIFLFILPNKRSTQSSRQISSQNNCPSPSFAPPDDIVNSPPKPLWYYLDGEEKQYGPMSLYALRKAWEAKEISSSTYLWNETMSDWEKLESLPKIFEEAQT